MITTYKFKGFDLKVLPSGEAHIDVHGDPVFTKAFLKVARELKARHGALYTKRPISDMKTDTFNRRIGFNPVKYDSMYVYYEWR